MIIIIFWERSRTFLNLVTKMKVLIVAFIRFGVKPEWLIVHRILNHRTFRDGSTQYFVKWRDLPYDQATWEDENSEIPAMKRAIEYYWVIENLIMHTKF